MYHVKVAGYDVIFPYEPYSIQKAYMSRLLDCLKNKKNGLLESPTGTGKTLSILCAAMAWLDCEQEKSAFGENHTTPSHNDEEAGVDLFAAAKVAFNDRPKVIYSSRTHVQLAQAMKELKRTYYANHPAVILGSRDQLCIHSEVKKLAGNALKNQACRVKVSQHACSFYESYEQKAAKAFADDEIIDIEDLVTKGTSGGFCPYYASRLHKNKAEVIFTPYNYLLVPSLRRSQGIELDNSVIIFDEGHNIESICEESASTSIESTKLAMCISELNVLLEKAKKEIESEDQTNDAYAYEMVKMVDEINTLGVDSIINLKNVLCDLESEIDQQLTSMPKDKNKELDAGWIVDLVREKLSLKSEHIEQITKSIDKIGSILSINTTPSTGSKVTAFESLSDFFKTIVPLIPSPGEDLNVNPLDFETEFKKKYRLSLSTEEGPDRYKKRMNKQWFVASKDEEVTTSWTLNIYCMSPSVAMNQLIEAGAKSIIITSGTLAPMLSFENEMEIPFPVKLENRHVIREDQLKVRVVLRSWNGVILDSKYTNRENMEYYKGLGDTIVEYSRIIPGGFFVFFSSYTVMIKTVELWKNMYEWKIWENLTESKIPFIEPKDKYSFADAITKFKSVIDKSNGDDSKKGSVFFGVTRGKLSEGMDIGNNYCRGVIIVGLPFPSCFDKRSILKKSYIESKRDPSYNFQTYYGLQMKRGLNQSIGRVIRHKDDYGVVLLCDFRFSNHKNSLSKWIQPFFSAEDDYRKIKSEIKAFFNNRSDSSQKSSEPMEENATAVQIPRQIPKFKSPLICTATAETKKSSDRDAVSQVKGIQELSKSQTDHPQKFFDIFKKDTVERVSDIQDLNSMAGPSKRTLVELVSDSRVSDEDSSSQDRNRKKLKVPLRGLSSVVEEVEDLKESDMEQVQRFVEGEGLQIRKIFQGTDKFAKLCQGLKKFSVERDLSFLIKLLRRLFADVKKPERDVLLGGMCLLVPKGSKGAYIEGLKINLECVPMDVFEGNRNMITVVRGQSGD